MLLGLESRHLPLTPKLYSKFPTHSQDVFHIGEVQHEVGNAFACNSDRLETRYTRSPSGATVNKATLLFPLLVNRAGKCTYLLRAIKVTLLILLLQILTQINTSISTRSRPLYIIPAEPQSRSRHQQGHQPADVQRPCVRAQHGVCRGRVDEAAEIQRQGRRKGPLARVPRGHHWRVRCSASQHRTSHTCRDMPPI